MINPQTGFSPIQTVYGKRPSSIPQYVLASSNLEAIDTGLATRGEVLRKLRENLFKTHKRKKENAEDKHRSDLDFFGGDWVYIKLQSSRQTTLTERKIKKTHKTFGPYQVIHRIDHVA